MDMAEHYQDSLNNAISEERRTDILLAQHKAERAAKWAAEVEVAIKAIIEFAQPSLPEHPAQNQTPITVDLTGDDFRDYRWSKSLRAALTQHYHDAGWKNVEFFVQEGDQTRPGTEFKIILSQD
jgi:hypothetical protein